MSLRRSFLSRKFSKSFREFNGGNRAADSDRAADTVESSTASSWSTLLPELLGEIIQRVEDSEDKWPHLQNVVACACVCKRWRDITKEIVRTPSANGKITFPSCLKQVKKFRLTVGFA